MTIVKKFNSLLSLALILTYSLSIMNNSTASWTHEEIINQLGNCSPETIQLYTDLKDEVRDPNQLALYLNLTYSYNERQNQVSQTIQGNQGKWTFQDIRKELHARNDYALNQLYAVLIDQTGDPNLLAESLGLVKIISSSITTSNDLTEKNVFRISLLEKLKQINRE